MTRRRTAASLALPGLEPERPKAKHIELRAPPKEAPKPQREPVPVARFLGDELHIDLTEAWYEEHEYEPQLCPGAYVSEAKHTFAKRSKYNPYDVETRARVRRIIDALRGSPEHAEYASAVRELRAAPRTVVATFGGAEGDYSPTQCSISPDRLNAATKALDAAALKLGAIDGDLSAIAIALSPAW